LPPYRRYTPLRDASFSLALMPLLLLFYAALFLLLSFYGAP